MTSSATPSNLCSQSLLRIGSKATIASLKEPSTEAQACNIFYQSTFEQLARSAPWNCLRAQMPLTLLAAAQGTPENQSGTVLPIPPVPWLYSYALPNDCLQMRFLVPSLPTQPSTNNVPITPISNAVPGVVLGRGQIRFTVAYSVDKNNSPIQVVLTNLTQAQAVYTVNQSNPVIWDGLFTQAFITSLSAYLVPALNMNAALLASAKQDAMAMIAQARIRDGDEGTVSQDHTPDWMRARNNQGGAYFNGNGPWLYGNSEMSWPAYG